MMYTVLPKVRLLSMIGLVVLKIFLLDFSMVQAKNLSTKVGKVSGTITFVGKLPQIRKFNLSTYPDPYYCGRISDGKGWRIGSKPRINDDSRLAGAIVFLKGPESSKPTEIQTVSVKSVNCRFSPFIGLLRVGNEVEFENWDPVLHQIEIFQSTAKGGRLLFLNNLNSHPDSLKSDFLQSGEIGTQQPGPPLLYEVKNEGVLFIRCPLHEYMEAWSVVLSHQFYAISDKDGQFSIADIPTGTHTLVVWHPIGQTEQTVRISGGDTLQLNLEFQPIRSIFYREPEVKTNPFGIDLLGDSHIIPSVELQKE